MEALLGIVAIAVVVYALLGIRSVPPMHAGVVERLGKYHRTARPGLTWITPFVDSVRRMDVREQVIAFPGVPVVTTDDQWVTVEVVVYFKVTDPVRATYEIANHVQAVEHTTIYRLRAVLGEMTLEQVRTSGRELEARLAAEIDEYTAPWGVKILRAEIKSIAPGKLEGASGARW
ncbi:MAG TPA: paraslipin [Candidatus Limnocylindrales bacterium]